MIVKTRHFGTIDLDESKIIEFKDGILGFENYKNFTLLYDNEKGDKPDISWLQSLEEPALALPVISPFLLMSEYNPKVEDELLKSLGELKDDNTVVLVSVTVPANITKITANLKAPFIINSDTKKGCQIVAENQDYEIKYSFYNKLQAEKKEKGACKC